MLVCHQLTGGGQYLDKAAAMIVAHLRGAFAKRDVEGVDTSKNLSLLA
jgi:hypothetical protein